MVKTNSCGGMNGALPACAPLANPYVPFQQPGGPYYSTEDALSQGTLFQGLNLPFYLKVNGVPVPQTPMAELQALCFVINELALYLDTHPDDQEAFEMFQNYVAMEEQAQTAYLKTGGPLMLRQTAQKPNFTWATNQWPWETAGGKN